MTLQVDIASKRFSNGHCALENLQLQARAGEFVAIVGPSGAGKSTLLKIVSGLDRDYQGSVGHAQAQHLAFMFQEPRLMPWQTVAQNLALVNRAMVGAKLQEALDRVGLGPCAPLYPGQLSGGMQRRVALLRAFCVAPRLLLMDEPFQSLDAPTAEQLRGLLLELWERDRPTVLFVTHKLSEALTLADRVVFLSQGPARVVLDLPVTLPRPRVEHSPQVQELHSRLLQQHPALLKGLTADG